MGGYGRGMYLEGVGEEMGKKYDPVSMYEILKNNKNKKKTLDLKCANPHQVELKEDTLILISLFFQQISFPTLRRYFRFCSYV